MFNKLDSKILRKQFWTSFGKSFPRKWVLYDTKIKDFSFKFYFNTKIALVSLDIEDKNIENRIKYYEKVESLKSILKEDFLPEIIFKNTHYLENGKEISRVYVQLESVSIHNKNTWQQTMLFLNDAMIKFEEFWFEYEEYIKG